MSQHAGSSRLLCVMTRSTNVAGLAAFELGARQLQIAEDKLSHRFADDAGVDRQGDYSLMSGSTRKSQLYIAPQLKAWIAGELQKDASILKERRKAREERILANPKKKGAPGKGGAEA